MKWIGQSIIDFIAGYRGDVYLDSPTAGGSDPDKFLGIDSNGKIIYRTGTEVLSDIGASSTTGDIEGVTAGNALTGGGTTGTVTLNHEDTSSQASVDNSGRTFVQDITLDTYGHVTGITSATDSDTHAGDITGVDITGGTNLTVASESGTTSGNYSCTLNVDDAFLINSGSDTTTGTITAAGFTTTGTWTFDTSAGGTTGVTAINVGSAFTDDDVTIMSAGAIKEKIEAYGYSTTTGDITGVTAGTNLSGGGTSGAVTLNLADASTSAKGAASFATADFAVSSGAVSLKERACFEFKGYGISSQDGEGEAVYEMSDILSDSAGHSPYNHNVATGTDGLDAMAVTSIVRGGGMVMPHGGSLKKFTGWISSQGTGAIDLGIFKFTPVDNNSSAVSAVLLVNEQITAAGNTKMRSFSEAASFAEAEFAAGDVLYSAVKGAVNSKLFYFLSTLEVEWAA